MEKLNLAFVARACGGQLKGPMVEAIFNGVSSDSRRIRPGEIFVALQGDCFDGHDFLRQAAERGAAAAIVSDPRKVPDAFDLPVIHVPNTLTALQQLAANYRKLMPLKTIAVTGSNGKTSTKEMLAALLAGRFQTIKSEGNLNNHIGVPLSLLRIRPFHEVGVFELAMNHPFELAPLAAMVGPVVGIITNVGPVHLEGMGDERGVAREKAAVIAALPPEGVAVLNADNQWTGWLRDYTRARIVTAGFAPDADVRAEDIRHCDTGVLFDLILPAMNKHWPGAASPSPARGQDNCVSDFAKSETAGEGSARDENGPAAHFAKRAPSAGDSRVADFAKCATSGAMASAAAQADGPARVTVTLRLLGDHWVSNALLAAAAARVLGLTAAEIAVGFEKVALPAMRMQTIVVDGTHWINDAYNANPHSMKAALNAQLHCPCRGRRVAVLGDMLELGAESESWHRQVGDDAAQAGVQLLVTVGKQARFMAEAAWAAGLGADAVVACETIRQASAVLRERVRPGDCVLVKASRGMKLESLVPAAPQTVDKA